MASGGMMAMRQREDAAQDISEKGINIKQVETQELCETKTVTYVNTRIKFLQLFNHMELIHGCGSRHI